MDNFKKFIQDLLTQLNIKYDYPKLYEYLECEPDASPSTLKQKYRYLSKLHHPDKSGSLGAERMIQINEAFFVLSDPEKRKIYDTTGYYGNLDWIHSLNSIPSFSPIVPLALHTLVIDKLGLKVMAMLYASEKSYDHKKDKIGLGYIAGFPFVHFITENAISLLLDKFWAKKENDNHQTIKVFISEVLATIIATPIEILAYNQCINGNQKFTLQNYFMASKMNWKVIGLVASLRIVYSLTYGFLLSLSNQYQIKALHANSILEDRVENRNIIIYKKMNKALTSNQPNEKESSVDDIGSDSDSDSDGNDGNGDSDREDEIQGLEDKKMELKAQIEEEYDKKNQRILKYIMNNVSYSNLSKFASYAIPSLFSIYRVFYRARNPSRSYFSIYLLQAAALDMLSHYIYDSLCALFPRVIFHAQNSIFKLFNRQSTNNK